MVMNEVVKLFLDSRKRGTTGARTKCSAKTLQIYEWNMKTFSGWLEERGISDYKGIKRIVLSEFLDWLDAKEANNEWRKATTLQILRTLKTFFRWVDKDDDCQLQELKGLQKYLPAIAKNPRRTDIPQTVDLKKFRNSFNTENRWGYRDYVATSLLMTNGLRISELCSLTIDNIRYEEKMLIVMGKQGTRLVPVTAEMLRLLKGWLKRRTLCKTATDSNYVFVSKYKGSMDADAFGKRFRKHCKKYGLPRISPHTFRHAFCTHYLKEGGDIEKLRNITGHTTYEMLKEYLHLAKLGGKETQVELEKINMLKD